MAHRPGIIPSPTPNYPTTPAKSLPLALHRLSHFKMVSTVAQKRLFHEYKNLSTNPPEGITAGPVSEDDMFYWEALIQGPEETPFEGGVFAAELKFPRDYPLSPPTMKFIGGGIWHPNGTCLRRRWRISTNRSQSIPTEPSASPFFILLAMTLTITNMPRSAGRLSRVWRRSSFPS